MSYYVVPLLKKPNQSLTTTLGGQNVEITLNTRLNNELYISIKADGEDIVTNRICRNKVKIVNERYKPIDGDLAFYDRSGNDDPNWEELGDRFMLIWSDDV